MSKLLLSDNGRYQDVRDFEGPFHSGKELFNNGSKDAQVTTYSADQNTFFNDFVTTIIKLDNIKPLLGKKGEIKKNCRRFS